MHKIYTLKQIETPRLIIRPVQLGDESELNKLINNSYESLQEWTRWADDTSLEATAAFIQKGVFAWSSQTIEYFPMVLIHKEDQKIIGVSGYNERGNLNEGICKIIYWCDIDYQGRGLVTECVNALTRYALNYEAKIVIIEMFVDNINSIAVAERLNFVNQGIRKSAVKDDAFNYCFTCVELDALPSLKVNWRHEANDGTIV